MSLREGVLKEPVLTVQPVWYHALFGHDQGLVILHWRGSSSYELAGLVFDISCAMWYGSHLALVVNSNTVIFFYPSFLITIVRLCVILIVLVKTSILSIYAQPVVMFLRN